jgi:hypothetical protein
MLNKEVCEKCWQGVWKAIDDTNWNKGYFICRMQCKDYRYPTLMNTNEIPKVCDRAFEHAVAAGVSHA